MNLVNISTAHPAQHVARRAKPDRTINLPRFHRIARLWTTNEDQEAAMTVKGVVQAWDSGMSDFRCSDPAPCRELSAVSKAEERVCSNSLLMGLHVDGFYFCLSLSPIACASISCSTCCQALIHQANTVLARAGSRQ